MPRPNDHDEPNYDDATAEELAWQVIEARLDAYHDECWESVSGEVLEDIRESALNDLDFSE